MILVDTSVWIDHFRGKVRLLEDLLHLGEVATHPFVIGELACGNINNRREILSLLSALPTLTVASHAEALYLVEGRKLHGRGIGWIDIHLLASSLVNHVPLWTRDKKLNAFAQCLGIARME